MYGYAYFYSQISPSKRKIPSTRLAINGPIKRREEEQQLQKLVCLLTKALGSDSEKSEEEDRVGKCNLYVS
jgi:hypothetical protein